MEEKYTYFPSALGDAAPSRALLLYPQLLSVVDVPEHRGGLWFAVSQYQECRESLSFPVKVGMLAISIW